MITGQAEIISNLDNALKIVAKTTNEALEEVGQRGVGIIKQNTPVKEGRLRNSMGYTIGNKVIGNDDTLDKIGDDKTVALGTNVIYAAKVEFMATNGSQGYFQRSFNQITPIAKKIFESVFKRGLK